MEMSDQAVLVGLAVFLLTLHVAGSVLILRTLRSVFHHVQRLDELAEIEAVLKKRGTRRGTGWVADKANAAAVKSGNEAASSVFKSMLKE